MGSLIASIGGGAASIFGQQQASKGEIEGARTQADIEAMGRGASAREFSKQMARQQPFIDVGTRALPLLTEAVSNRGDASGLPGTQIQRDFVTDFLGDQAPGFIKDEALLDINAIEAENQKRRLSDLVNVALGGSASQSGSAVNLGSTVGQSLTRQGNTLADALQQSAINRQNTANQVATGISGLPAFFASRNQQQQPAFGLTQISNTGAFNPSALRR